MRSRKRNSIPMSPVVVMQFIGTILSLEKRVKQNQATHCQIKANEPTTVALWVQTPGIVFRQNIHPKVLVGN